MKSTNDIHSGVPLSPPAVTLTDEALSKHDKLHEEGETQTPVFTPRILITPSAQDNDIKRGFNLDGAGETDLNLADSRSNNNNNNNNNNNSSNNNNNNSKDNTNNNNNNSNDTSPNNNTNTNNTGTISKSNSKRRGVSFASKDEILPKNTILGKKDSHGNILTIASTRNNAGNLSNISNVTDYSAISDPFDNVISIDRGQYVSDDEGLIGPQSDNEAQTPRHNNSNNNGRNNRMTIPRSTVYNHSNAIDDPANQRNTAIDPHRPVDSGLIRLEELNDGMCKK